ncbi:ATP-binding cassette domain-containing protein [Rhodococcus opacus]|uniref:ATP-binding cassette domain-containing protein n=1 Tax=Rhodococcus opacus TaxID=37919 RepID=UPI000A812BC8|nr:ATP-binding cassette domain-containing protein [Rhodococcus opacus]
MSSDIAIRTVGLTTRFGSMLALGTVDVNIVEGEVFGYLGPNGAGKSTTLRLLVGLLRPTAGSAHVFGLDAWSSAPAVHRLIGYVPGELALYDRMTGRRHITYFGHLRGNPGDKAATVFADRLDLDLDRTVRTMSNTDICAQRPRACGVVVGAVATIFTVLSVRRA